MKSDAFFLLSFFLVVIIIGTLLLLLPFCWISGERVAIIDAMFMAASAVCVTGLATVDVSSMSRTGHIILIFLVQVGGLGIISVTSLLLMIPGHRLALWQRNVIQGFYIDGVEYRPRRIVRRIVSFTLLLELSGMIALALSFRAAGVRDWIFMGFFHGISAFCNAGFTPFENGLIPFAENAPVVFSLIALIVLGGLGFIVIDDVLHVIFNMHSLKTNFSRRAARTTQRSTRRTALSYHSRVVLAMTGFLITGGALLFFLLEHNRAFSGNIKQDLLCALFQAVTPRTAGFEMTAQKEFTELSRMLTVLLMLVGGAPGSIAGGIKVTTLFVIALVATHSRDDFGDIKILHHRIPASSINQAVVYFLKAIALLLVCVAALFITEGSLMAQRSAEENALAIIFEVVSAFATVGLSLELTPTLSTYGKLVIIAAMFAGRVGLVALAFPALKSRTVPLTYPSGSILLG